MTQFFATPDETQTWVETEVERLRLTVRQDRLPGGSLRCFLWPRDAQPPSGASSVAGVMVDFPTIAGRTLTMGVTGWKASAFQEPVASQGRRLARQLTRSLRKVATVPLYAVSYDESSRSDKPDAWGTPTAVSTGMALRQWRDGSVTFQP